MASSKSGIVVQKVSKLTDFQVYGKETRIARHSWKLLVYKHVSQETCPSKEYLAVYLRCTEEPMLLSKPDSKYN